MLCFFWGISGKYLQDTCPRPPPPSNNNELILINPSIITETKIYMRVSFSSASGAKNYRFSVLMFERVLKALDFYERFPLP